MPEIMPVTGTRDFFPEEMAFRAWLYAKMRRVSEAFGYQEYDAPFLESLELYAAKSGEELVRQQAYVFEDRGGDLITLRPELTPSLARMIASRVKAMPTPIRWWSFGPFWRYERPQRGRTREFFQWNIDLLGVDSAEADAEIAAIGAEFFRNLDLSPGQIRILINNRRLVEQQLDQLAIPADRWQEVFHLIDRLERTEPEAWEQAARAAGLDDDRLHGLQQILEDDDAWQQSDELQAFFETSRALGVGEYVSYDPSVIRGLDYYTGTVFEARDATGRHRAILGGGRYDNLVADVGGDQVPGVGFAMGDVVLELVLREAGAFPELQQSPSQVLLTLFDDRLVTATLELAHDLRQAGLRVEWFPEPARLGRQLKYADRYGIPWVAILGPEEIEAGQVTVKDMASGEQKPIARAEVAAFIQAGLDASAER